MSGFITHDQINVYPFKIEKLLELSISQKPNEHSKMILKGIIPYEEKEDYMGKIYENQTIEISVDRNEEKINIFKGVIGRMDIENDGDVRIVNMEAFSFTFLMDMQKKNLSYQCAGMTYGEFFNRMTQSYNSCSFIDSASKGNMIESVIVQNNESDWSFLKRLSSRFNMPVIANSRMDGIKAYIGLPDTIVQEVLTECSYKMIKNVKKYQEMNKNNEIKLNETEKISFEIVTEKMLEPASKVRFNGIDFRVYSSKIELKAGLLQNTCNLRKDKGFMIAEVENNSISGTSIEGRVQDVFQDKLKIRLDTDYMFEESKAFFFKYSTPYSSKSGSGFYFMPEKDDRVSLYFPNADESKAYSKSSVNMESESYGRTNPDIKRISTKYGKEIVMKPDGIEIIANGKTMLKLLDDGGIIINSERGIKISAKDDIDISSGRGISITGQAGVNIKQGNSTIDIADGIDIRGSKVNMK